MAGNMYVCLLAIFDNLLCFFYLFVCLIADSFLFAVICLIGGGGLHTVYMLWKVTISKYRSVPF